MDYKVYVPEYGTRIYSKIADGELVTYKVTLPGFTGQGLLLLELNQRTNTFKIITSSPRSIDTLNNLYALLEFFKDDFIEAEFISPELNLKEVVDD